jgi:hypothetical protein
MRVIRAFFVVLRLVYVSDCKLSMVKYRQCSKRVLQEELRDAASVVCRWKKLPRYQKAAQERASHLPQYRPGTSQPYENAPLSVTAGAQFRVPPFGDGSFLLHTPSLKSTTCSISCQVGLFVVRSLERRLLVLQNFPNY